MPKPVDPQKSISIYFTYWEFWTRLIPLLFDHNPWKHKKTIGFFESFRGYIKRPVEWVGLRLHLRSFWEEPYDIVCNKFLKNLFKWYSWPFMDPFWATLGPISSHEFHKLFAFTKPWLYTKVQTDEPILKKNALVTRVSLDRLHLTYFQPMSLFHTPWKHHKTFLGL